MSLLRLMTGRSLLTRCALRPSPVCVSALSTKQLQEETVEESKRLMARNEKLKRPTSPWLIYKVQMTMGLSFTHRMTGLALSVLVYGWGISEIFAKSNFVEQITWLQATFPSSFLSLIKFLTITSFGYHLFNGIRHLCWDMGLGFSLKEMYLSGYVVLALTAIVAVIALMNY